MPVNWLGSAAVWDIQVKEAAYVFTYLSACHPCLESMTFNLKEAERKRQRENNDEDDDDDHHHNDDENDGNDDDNSDGVDISTCQRLRVEKK